MMSRLGILGCCIGAWAALVPTPAIGQSEWTVQDPWDFSVGDGVGPGHELHRVADATLLADGRLVVLNGGTNEVLVYRSPGRLTQATGQEGGGPGEYSQPTTLRGDDEGGLWVYDPGNSRTTHLDSQFEVIETQRTVYSFGTGRLIAALRPLTNGLVPLIQGTIPLMEIRNAEGVLEPRWRVLLVDDTSPTEVAQLSGGEEFWTGVEQGIRLNDHVPFGQVSLYGSGPTSLVVGSSHARTFRVLDATGTEIATVDADGEPRSVTTEDWGHYQESFREKHTGVRIRGMTTNPRAAVQSFLSRAPRGEDFPMFDELQVDALARVWVREYSLAGATRRWQVHSATNGLLAFLEVPRDWIVLEFGDGYLVALTMDEFDMEVVRVHQIVG